MEIENKTQIYIFGFSPFAEIIAEYLKETPDIEFKGFIVDDEFVEKIPTRCDIYSWGWFSSSVDPESCEIVVAIGYNQMNRTREVVFKKIKGYGYKIASFYHSTATISPSSSLGEGCIVLEKVTIQPFVKCGDGNVFWSNVNICHHTIVGNFNFFAASSCVLGKIVIGNNCFFGSNCTIKNRVIIGNYCLVGAGSFVRKDICSESVIVPSDSIILDKKSSEIKI